MLFCETYAQDSVLYFPNIILQLNKNTVLLCLSDTAESGERNSMKEIFEQYGGILITVAAILSVILVIVAVIGTNGDSIIGRAFSSVIERFIEQAGMNSGI